MLRHMVKSAIIVGTIAGVLLPMFAGDAVTANNTGGEVMAVAAPAATLPPLLKITTEGLHRLTGNLKVVDPDRNVIEIAASNVTLDLNGYTISGPAVCSYGTPVTCTHSTNIGNGIYASVLGKPLNLTIMNGSIHGMASYAILSDSETAIRVERVNVTGNGHGIFANYGIVSNCVVIQNAGTGITGSGLLVTGNTVEYNGGNGLSANFVSGYSNNVFIGNGPTGTTNVIGGAVQMGVNACNGAACP